MGVALGGAGVMRNHLPGRLIVLPLLMNLGLTHWSTVRLRPGPPTGQHWVGLRAEHRNRRRH
jgi:hypothetical protein